MSENPDSLLNNPYGQASFYLFRNEDKAFADKSLMIKYLDDKGMTKYPVLLRPRRFGKSTFVQMLKCYYDISYKDRYEDLFSGTEIYMENLPSHNSYHVINFDFSSVSTVNLDKLSFSFMVAVSSGIRDFKRRYKDFVFNYTYADVNDATTLFSEFANAYLDYSGEQKLYVLIDEYDNFANDILSRDLELILNITRKDGLLKNFYAEIKAQTSSAIDKTFITGVSSVSLDFLTSGFNIALNITSDDSFNEYAGLTEDELKVLIPQLVDVEKLGVSTEEIISKMKDVYDGYCFSRKAENTVFNTSMCLYYLTELRRQREFLNPEDYFDPACDQEADKLNQLFNFTSKEIAGYVIETYLRGEDFYLNKLSENINLNNLREFSRDQMLSMLYYLGYLTIDRENSTKDQLALMIPNRFMKNLFAKCTINYRFSADTEFNAQKLDISALLNVEDDLTSFAKSCTEFLSSIMTNQVLSHMNEMALNLVLFAKLNATVAVSTLVKMQKSLQVPKEGEKFADLVVMVNLGSVNECVYLFEFKYLTKSEASFPRYEENLRKLIENASKQVLEYKSAIDFKDKLVKPYVMIFVGPECVYCMKQN